MTLAQSLFSPKKEEDAIFKIESLQYYYKQLYHKPPAFCMVGLNKLLTCNRYICSKTFVTFLGAEIHGDFSVWFHLHSNLFWIQMLIDENRPFFSGMKFFFFLQNLNMFCQFFKIRSPSSMAISCFYISF